MLTLQSSRGSERTVQEALVEELRVVIRQRSNSLVCERVAVLARVELGRVEPERRARRDDESG